MDSDAPPSEVDADAGISTATADRSDSVPTEVNSATDSLEVTAHSPDASPRSVMSATEHANSQENPSTTSTTRPADAPDPHGSRDASPDNDPSTDSSMEAFQHAMQASKHSRVHSFATTVVADDSSSLGSENSQSKPTDAVAHAATGSQARERAVSLPVDVSCHDDCHEDWSDSEDHNDRHRDWSDSDHPYPDVQRLLTVHESEPPHPEPAAPDGNKDPDPIADPPRPAPSQSEDDPAKYNRGIASQMLGLTSSLRRRQKPGTRKKPGFLSKLKPHKQKSPEAAQTQYLGETIYIRKYIIKLGEALMLYGAPTHRIEEYLRSSATQLSIAASFLYLPGATIIAFDDSYTSTAEVRLVRVSHNVDLSRLKDVYDVYKTTLRHRLTPKDAVVRLEELMQRKQVWNTWWLILAHAVASASIGPFAFKGNWLDLVPSFLLGGLLGAGRLWLCKKSQPIENCYEFMATTLTTMVARLLGSILRGGSHPFCFAAIAQSSIATILPGYTVLCGAMELQSKHIVSGAARVVFSLIYTLFLAFGINVGSLISGVILKTAGVEAISDTTCARPISNSYIHFIFVPVFVAANLVLFQGRLKQAPMVLLISFAGFQVVYWMQEKATPNSSQIATACAAATIGLLSNLNARYGLEDKINRYCAKHIKPVITKVWQDNLVEATKKPSEEAEQMEEGNIPSRPSSPVDSHNDTKNVKKRLAAAQDEQQINSLAVASLLPAVFVLVPGGIAFSGSLVAGLQAADATLKGNATSTSQTATGVLQSGGQMSDSGYGNVAWSVLQVAIGITAGLFVATAMVYPLGKKRSALFTF